MNFSRTIVLLLIFISILSAQGQEKKQDLVIGHFEKIDSEIYGKEIEILVSLPSGYEKSTQSYPVFFGIHSDPKMTASITSSLSRGSIPKTIYVHVIDYNSGDFIPTPANNQPNTGKADRLKRFFRDELIPYINNNYRTENFRILQASAWGGVFCLYTFLSEPELFNAHLATNPWFIYDAEKKFIINYADSLLKSGGYNNKFLFMSNGNDDDPGLKESYDEFALLLKNKKSPKLFFTAERWPEEDHQSVIHTSTWRGLKWIFEKATKIPSDILTKGSDAVKQYQSQLVNIYGYEIKINTSQIWMYGWQLMREEKYQKAVEIFQMFCEFNPGAHYGPMGVAKAFEKMNDLNSALKYFEQARAIALKVKLKDENRYLPDIARVKMKLGITE